MTNPRRLQVAGATFAFFAAATCSQIWGDSAATPSRAPKALAAAIRTPDVATAAADIGGRFAKQPVITYQPLSGDLHFALQLKATLPPSPARGRDVLVAIDTTASQAGRPLQNARSILEELSKAARPDDRIDVWTMNTPDTTRSLTQGFQPANGAKVKDQIEYLAKKEYAAGAADLKTGLRKALADFGDRTDREKVILFLGDGESCLNPLTDAGRAALAADMASREIAFFPVPLGSRLDPANLHGLASATGGIVVRMLGEESAERFIPKLMTAFDAPIFYPAKTNFSADVAEALPNRLPPVRGDAPTLVAGLLKSDAKTIGVTAEGSLAGHRHTLTISEAVPAADASNYFLVGLVHQWQSADRSAPALVRADRSLALAYEQTRLARDEVLTQANWALSENKLDAAGKLFEAAHKFDPADNESRAGLKVVAKLKDGQITRDQLRQQLSDPKQFAVRFANGAGAKITPDQLVKLSQGQPPTPEAPPVAGTIPAPTPVGGADLLEQERRRRLVQEQQVTQVVDDVISRAKREITSDPDVAYDLLKRQLSSVRENTDLSDRVRATLAARLEGTLRWAVAEGTRVRQSQQAELQRRLADEARRSADVANTNEQEMIRERIKAFGNLMNQARFEEAYKEALVLQQEQVSKGRSVPVAATAAYQMGLNAANLREFDEMRRLKEDRFLLTMLLVEKSHIPFPDEPPVAFPPAATWRELTALRKDKYDAIGLEGPGSRNALKIRDQMNNPVSIEKAIDGSPLKDVLEFLSDKYGLTFIVDTQAFEAAGAIGGKNVEDNQVRLPKMPGVTLGTVMRFLLAQFGGTYIIRRDYVEITTNERAVAEKAVRAYPVADLVIPIPNGVNQSSLNQNLQVLGSSLSANGMALFGAGGGGQALGFQGALGALGVLGPLGAIGAAGGVGGGGGAIGAIAGGGASGAGFQGALGFAGGNNQTNLGAGGGVLGFGGGQQGQFGNLGGQFGLQGGDTSAILIELIQDVIAPKEWQLRAARYLFNNTNVQSDEEAPVLNTDQLNSLGYYQPARALVVRASSRIHTRVGGNIAGPGGAPGRGALDRPGGDALVIRPGERARDPNRATVAAVAKPQAAEDVVKGPRDAQKVWNDAFNDRKHPISPRHVIAASDALAVADKFEEVVALLQADLRRGVLVQPCVFDALAIALKASGGTPEERERVLLSGIDLDPKSPQSYLRAAEAMNELGKPDQALAFCKRAAALEPNAADPYSQSLVYLTSAKTVDSDAVEWAAGNLIRRDWAADRDLHQAKAQKAFNDAVARLRAAGRSADADKVQSAMEREKQRDLVIEAAWSDLADLDLEVTEPTGAVCSPKEPQSTGGGLWRGDQVMDVDRNEKFRETYTAGEAFSGSYEIRVKKVWGQPLSDKVTIRVTRHQGTPDQTQELHRLTLGSDGTAYLKVNVADGRRTNLASVPPPAQRKAESNVAGTRPDKVYNLLRQMSDPVYSGMTRRSMTGGAAAASPSAMQLLDGPQDASGPEVVHQNRMTGDDANHSGAEMMGRATVASDRSKVTVHMAPVFQTATDRTDVKLSAIPGGQ